MKNIFKKLVGVVMTLALVFIPFMKVHAEEIDLGELPDPINVATEEEFVEKLQSEEAVYLVLTANINLTKPLEISGEVIIDGAGQFTLDGTNIQALPGSGNKSIVTAVGEGAEVALINITLANAPKYGVQAYNGGAILVNGVTIKDCGFGAILLNGGTGVIQDLTMIHNGSFEDGKTGNGIELAQGDAVTESPYLLMDGTFTTENQDTAIWVAENNPALETVMYGNTEGSEYKLSIEENALVVRNKNNEVVTTSNAALEDVNTEEVEQPSDTPNTPDVPTQNPEENPSTSDNLVIFVGLAIAALGLGTVTFRKLCK